MPIACNVQLPPGCNDACEVVRKCLRLIRSGAANLETLRLEVHLTASANSGVVIRLAEQLPETSLGFRVGGSARAKTAGEFRGQNRLGFSTFQGTITEYLPAVDALRLVEGLLQSPPQAIRSTSFTLYVHDVHWKESPADSSGALYLFDFKGTKRASRFTMSAVLRCSGEDPKSPALREMLKRVSLATGIPFEKGGISRVAERRLRTAENAEAALVAQICYDEAVEDACDHLPDRTIPRIAVSALPKGRAFDARLEQWLEGGKRVNFLALLKCSVGDALPELAFQSAAGDEIVFSKEFIAGAKILVTFFKSNPRLGRTFTVNLGVCSTETGLRFETNVFRLGRTAEAQSWIYSGTADAVMALKEATELVKEVLPFFEYSLRGYLSPWPSAMPKHIQRPGTLTAREAFQRASVTARKQYPDAQLIRLSSRCRSGTARDMQRLELSPDGRLTTNGAWCLHFYSTVEDASFELIVPAIGRIQVWNHGEQFRDVNSRRYLLPLGDEWIDSNRVFAIAENLGKHENNRKGNIFGITARLQMSKFGRNYWSVTFLIADERGRNDSIFNLDAITGEEITDIKGS